MTLFSLHNHPADRAAAIDETGRTLSYGDLIETAERLGAKTRPATVALVLCRNTLGCVASVVGLLQIGVVPILIDADANATTVDNYLQLYQPEWLVRPLGLMDTSQAPMLQILDYDVFALEQQATRLTPHPDLALLLTTSGSTGSPKLVRQSRGNLQANAKSIQLYLGLDEQERPLTTLPLHYSFGFSVLNSHLHAGATLLVTQRSVLEKTFWDFCKAQQATSLAGVPYTYQMLKRMGFTRQGTGSLRMLTQAGGKIGQALAQEFAEHAAREGHRFFMMYGQTEATARISYVPSDRACDKASSIGIAIPGGELFLVDERGAEIHGNHIEGQLGYRGPNVTLGYAEQRADLARPDERGGVLLTGDLATRDDEGYYHITGRLNRIVKLFGKRVSLEDLEEMCLERVPEVACVGTEDHVTIWVTQGAEQPALPRWLADRTAIHASAYQVRVVDRLPHTASGKIDYRALREEEAT